MIETPTTINVLGVEFSIKEMDAPASDSLDAFGFYSGKHQVIFLESAMSPTKKANVFLHELLHAIDYSLSVSCSIRDAKELKDARENLANLVAVGLHKVMQDNPHIFKWLMELQK